MSERSWEKIRSRRRGPSVAKGYERARSSFELGEQVRAMRETQGLSQAELAKRIGSTQPAIARLEAGGVAPTVTTLGRIAAALGRDLVVTFPKAKQAD